MLTEKEDAGFLIDLDLAVNIDREQPSGAKSRTGTKVFMAISALYGFSHTFMHDLESIFWVLFWICVHYNGPEEKQAVDPQFEEWNYFDPTVLGTQKTGQIGMIFEKVDGSVTPFCKPLLPCLKSLHDQVFPDDKPRRTEDLELYSGMKRVFKEARDNFEIKTIVQC